MAQREMTEVTCGLTNPLTLGSGQIPQWLSLSGVGVEKVFDRTARLRCGVGTAGFLCGF